MEFCGTLHGHNGWVTQIATTNVDDMIVSSSRDKTLILWKIRSNELNYAIPLKRFIGHSHFINDVMLSSNGDYALSGSWDKTMLLWDIDTGRTIRRFVGHTKDILSVAFSPDDRYIISGGRDNIVKVWNTLGQCKHTIKKNGHTDWVSSVRFSPRFDTPTMVTGSWDKTVKIWDFSNCHIKTNIVGQFGYINAVAVSPDGVLCAWGGTEGKINIWNMIENKHTITFNNNDIIQTLCFNPKYYWLCAAIDSFVIIWDLKTKSEVCRLGFNFENTQKNSNTESHICLSLAWSVNGQTLFAGYSDHIIRVWKIITFIGVCKTK